MIYFSRSSTHCVLTRLLLLFPAVTVSETQFIPILPYLLNYNTVLFIYLCMGQILQRGLLQGCEPVEGGRIMEAEASVHNMLAEVCEK